MSVIIESERRLQRRAADRAPIPVASPRRAQEPPQRLRTVQLALFDVSLVALSAAIALTVRTAPALQPYWVQAGFSPVFPSTTLLRVVGAVAIFQALALPFVLASLNRYRPAPEESPEASWAYVGLVVVVAQYPLLAALYVLRLGSVPRGLLVLDVLLLATLLPAWRVLWASRERKRLSAGQGLRNVLVVGDDRDAQSLAVEIVGRPLHGMRIVGFLTPDRLVLDHVPADVLARRDVWAEGFVTAHDAVTPRTGLRAAVETNVSEQPRHLLASVGGFEAQSVAQALDGLCVEEVFVSSRISEDAADVVVRACRERGIDVHMIPPHHLALGTAPSPWTLGPFTLMSLYRSPISRPEWALKRGMDIFGGLVGLVVFSPVLLASAIAIKVENPRAPIFYRGLRVGLKGRHFRILKLATMVVDADAHREKLRALNARDGPWFQIDADKDPRITRVGRILRKYTINEIPQFWNVVMGDMSLVGPRPLATDEVSRFVDYDFRYYRTFDVKPGMTGLWQVKARKDPSFETRIRMDFEYIEKWSLWMDVALLVETPLALLKAPGR